MPEPEPKREPEQEPDPEPEPEAEREPEPEPAPSAPEPDHHAITPASRWAGSLQDEIDRLAGEEPRPSEPAEAGGLPPDVAPSRPYDAAPEPEETTPTPTPPPVPS